MNDKWKENIKQIDRRRLQSDLVSWFEREKRDLPWRRSKDPYNIWVSEIMLQQTKVDTVIPYYERFLEKFPTMESFASADDESVLKIWEGLGYYSRVRNLHSAIKEVVENYNSQVPDTREEISKLRGIGPYTAGAILSIAYGKPEHAVDGNVMRVLSRILRIEQDIAKPATRKTFEQAVSELIDHDNPSSFNQGLMELGALVCTPTSPSCLLCPVREHCLAFEAGVEKELPIKTRKKSTKHVDLVAAVLKTEDEKFLIRKRPSKGLLADLWEFPNVESLGSFGQMRTTIKEYIQNELHISSDIETGAFTKVDHVFSHLTWSINVFAGEFQLPNDNNKENCRVVTREELEQYAFPVSHQTIWRTYLDKYL